MILSTDGNESTEALTMYRNYEKSKQGKLDQIKSELVEDKRILFDDDDGRVLLAKTAFPGLFGFLLKLVVPRTIQQDIEAINGLINIYIQAFTDLYYENNFDNIVKIFDPNKTTNM